VKDMSHEATELELYADNSERLYHWKMALFEALARKKDRAIFDETLAPKIFASLLKDAAKAYEHEYMTAHSWRTVFPTSVRAEVAESFTREFLTWYDTDRVALQKKSEKSA